MSPILNFLGLYQVNHADGFSANFLKNMCIYAQGTCNYVLSYLANEHFDEEDLERERVYFGHFPSGSSLKTWVHMNQIVDTQ